MSLFGGKKTYVASSLYNLAGDVKDRPQFLQGLVIGNILADDTQNGISETLQGGYLNGPGIRLRTYYRWADRVTSSDPKTYNQVIGLTSGGLTDNVVIDPVILAEQIPHDPDQTVVLQKYEYGVAEHTYWAEQWMLANDPDAFNVDWDSDIDNTTNEITIVKADGDVTFMPVDYRKDALYIYAGYTLSSDVQHGAVVPGVPQPVANFPDTTGWTNTLMNDQAQVASLTKTIVTENTYSDARPPDSDTQTSSADTPWTLTDQTWEQTTEGGLDVIDGTEFIGTTHHWMYFKSAKRITQTITNDVQHVDIGGGVTKTVTTTTTQDVLNVDKTVQNDHRNDSVVSWTTTQMWIYRLGSGNAALDGMASTAGPVEDYFPPIPVRLNNQFISETYYSEEYEQSKRAFRKLTSTSYDDLVKKLADNDSLKDLDYIYVSTGVPFNVIENASKKYLFEFFYHCMLGQVIGTAEYEAWIAANGDAQGINDTWQTWHDAQLDPGDPLYGTPEPPRADLSGVPKNEVRVSTQGNVSIGYDMIVSWTSIEEETGGGLAKPDAKRDEIWIEKGDVAAYDGTVWGGAIGPLVDSYGVELTTIFWQVTPTSWRRLVCHGLEHKNYVYQGKFVDTTAHQALDDPDESGFLVPLNIGVWSDMNLVDQTQMGTACVYLVINTYQVVKQKWYETTIFKIILFVVIVVVAIYFPPAGATIGSMFAATVGLTGVAFAIAVAVVNALASMILMQILSIGLTKILGAKGAAIALFVLEVASIASGGGSFHIPSMTDAVNTLMQAQNILKVTEAIASGIGRYAQAEAQDVFGKITQVQSDYEKQAKQISDLYEQNIGYGTSLLDPLALTQLSYENTFSFESEDTFLTRTLMTGSDVAQLSLDLVTNFSDLTLSTELPG